MGFSRSIFQMEFQEILLNMLRRAENQSLGILSRSKKELEKNIKEKSMKIQIKS